MESMFCGGKNSGQSRWRMREKSYEIEALEGVCDRALTKASSTAVAAATPEHATHLPAGRLFTANRIIIVHHYNASYGPFGAIIPCNIPSHATVRYATLTAV